MWYMNKIIHSMKIRVELLYKCMYIINMNKTLLSLAALLSLTLASYADTGVCNESDDISFEQGFTDFADVVFVRPISLAVTGGIGFPAYAVSAPFTAMTGDNAEAWDTLVVKPAEFTFDREIGEFEK